MVNMNKISIVVAVYNSEKTLQKCVDSLLNQTYTNIEIILVNDCSKDRSLSICEQYGSHNNRIVVVNNQKNQGVSATRNKGIDVSTGDYICFVDSDDYVEPNYVSSLVSYYKQFDLMPICGFVFHDEYNHRNPVKYTWGEKNEVVCLDRAFELYDKIYLGALWNKLFDNQIIKHFSLKFDESLSMGEDLRFSLEYLLSNKQRYVYVCNETLYHYMRLTSDSLMTTCTKAEYTNGLYNLMLIKKVSDSKYIDMADVVNDHVLRLQNNYVYRIIKYGKYNKQEKILIIKQIKSDFSELDYIKVKWLVFKERLKCFLSAFRGER